MLDAYSITNYKRSKDELQLFILFALMVAGKNADTTDKACDCMWVALWKNIDHEFGHKGLTYTSDLKASDPFKILSMAIREEWLTPQTLKGWGFGCYNLKFKGIKALVESNLDLRTCTTDDLEKIPGIGKKTSRFFIIHSREGAQVAALDTHILKFLKASKVKNVPKSTPTSKKEYARLEQAFLKLVPKNIAPADFDLWLWRHAKAAQQEGIKDYQFADVIEELNIVNKYGSVMGMSFSLIGK